MTAGSDDSARELATYVALLRGINVGGNNRVPMAELRAVLTALGLVDVRTYIASGNVLVRAPGGRDARQRIAALVGHVVADQFDVTCSVLALTGERVRSIAAALPDEWLADESLRLEVLYLFDDVDHPGIVDELPDRAGVDEIRYTPGAVLWAVSKEQRSRTGLTRIVGGPLYKRMTGRNARTARTLARMAAD